MIEEQAQVTEVRDGVAFIEVIRGSVCQGCDLNAGCGTGALGRLLGFRQKPYSVSNELDLKPGDKVVLEVAEKSFALAGILVYLLPLVNLFAFAMIADLWFGAGDAVTVVVALVGLFSGLWFTGWLSRHALAKNMQPRVVRRIW